MSPLHMKNAYEMKKRMSDGKLKVWGGGYQKNNTLGTYLHTHFAGDYQMAKRFVQRMRDYRMANEALE